MSWDEIGLLRHRIIGILPMTTGFVVTVGFVVAILDLPANCMVWVEQYVVTYDYLLKTGIEQF